MEIFNPATIPKFRTLTDLIAYHQNLSPYEQELLSNYLNSLSPSAITEFYRLVGLPIGHILSLQEVKILHSLNFHFSKKLRFNKEAFEFFLIIFKEKQNAESSFEIPFYNILSTIETLDQFKNFLFYFNLSPLHKIKGYFNQTRSFYFYVGGPNEKEICQYLYQEGLDIYENIYDLLTIDNFKHFLKDYRAELITYEQFEILLKNISWPETNEEIYDLINLLKNILNYHHYASKNILYSLYKNVTYLPEINKLSENFFVEYFHDYLSEEIYLEMFEDKQIKESGYFMDLSSMYGFEKIYSSADLKNKFAEFYYLADFRNLKHLICQKLCDKLIIERNYIDRIRWLIYSVSRLIYLKWNFGEEFLEEIREKILEKCAEKEELSEISEEIISGKIKNKDLLKLRKIGQDIIKISSDIINNVQMEETIDIKLKYYITLYFMIGKH